MGEAGAAALWAGLRGKGNNNTKKAQLETQGSGGMAWLILYISNYTLPNTALCMYVCAKGKDLVVSGGDRDKALWPRVVWILLSLLIDTIRYNTNTHALSAT